MEFWLKLRFKALMIKNLQFEEELKKVLESGKKK
jgi:hypothetical protein